MALDYQPLFVLTSGMLLQERKLATVTHNLANADTPSFKRDFLLVSAWFTDNGTEAPDSSPENPTRNFVYPMVSEVFTDLSQGPLRQTGNSFDLAIEGEGFFAVRTPQGILYTRKGNFRLDAEGYLVTEEGFRVLDTLNTEIRIRGGKFYVDEAGNIYIDGVRTVTLGVWTLQNPQKVGQDFFSGTPQAITGFRVKQGYLELSNVNPIVEMVRLIETSRAHEVYSRLVQAVDEVQGRANSLAR